MGCCRKIAITLIDPRVARSGWRERLAKVPRRPKKTDESKRPVDNAHEAIRSNVDGLVGVGHAAQQSDDGHEPLPMEKRLDGQRMALRPRDLAIVARLSDK